VSECYRPGNGTEGMAFAEMFCLQCERDRAFWEETGDGCEIAARVLIYDEGDPEYPTEWTYDASGNPTCTAFLPIGSQLPTDTDLEILGQLSLLSGPDSAVAV
jgi:hypothetical protein